VLAAAGLGYLMSTGLSAREEPWPLETVVATRVRDLTIGWHARKIHNPSPEVIAEGRAHFADHCATCHAMTEAGTQI
jgi:mono/diheme cytochrome c family protein